MKKKTELAPSELWANHLLKRIIKGPGPAKIIFKKIQQKGKTLRARTKMKLVQINSIVIGERHKTNSHHSLERKATQARH
jgi:hypothetical protein